MMGGPPAHGDCNGLNHEGHEEHEETINCQSSTINDAGRGFDLGIAAATRPCEVGTTDVEDPPLAGTRMEAGWPSAATKLPLAKACPERSRMERQERKGSRKENTLEPWRSLRLRERHNVNVRNGLAEIRTPQEVLYETEEDI